MVLMNGIESGGSTSMIVAREINANSENQPRIQRQFPKNRLLSQVAGTRFDVSHRGDNQNLAACHRNKLCPPWTNPIQWKQ